MILTHLSFSISDGDILFIRGPSGVGKSLLLRAVAYLDPIQVGCPVAALSVALRGICCCLLAICTAVYLPCPPSLTCTISKANCAISAERLCPGSISATCVFVAFSKRVPESLQEGTLALNGRTPEQWSVPSWRAQVTYVPQTRVSVKGTPSELYFSAQASTAGLE